MTTNPTREEQKAEALKRMALMELPPDIIRAFEESGTVMACGDADGKFQPTDEKTLEKIKEIENQYGLLVYLSVNSELFYDSLSNLLFVGKYPEEWEMDHADLIDGYTLVYCINWTSPMCSEMGSIAVERTPSGGIIRAM